ncbi:MAG: ABC transporter ATP-binding protein [Chloroherpetonaceae bacterium]|nr:ABC transporter ATP-binding protein [Chloroherpetonaceae bacterium]MCS7210018.1 ABC transporter ATP-binding protein [Chloroherpetonaceae bacterium]MDW8020786.1 ABC transporter ATP-binding protein [Chloroherpetonaceae bacterium]
MKLKVEHLTKRFGSQVALEDLSFECGEAEFFAVLGKSGSGKSTLARILAGLEKPDAGRIWFGEKEVTKLAPHRRRAVMVFQNYALFPHLNVFENIAFGLREARIAEREIQKIVVETAKVLRIEERLYRSIAELSGGEQQRVAIARALAAPSELILFDEPLSNLDVVLRRELQKELKALQRQTRKTFLYITHDQEEALMLADRLMLLHQGRLVEIGAPREIYECPKTHFGATFIGDANTVRMKTLDKNLLTSETGLVLRHACDSLPAKVFDVVIRPEHIVPVARAQGENVFRAVVQEEFFRGAFSEYRLRVEGEHLTMKTVEPFKKEGFVQIRKFYLFAQVEN